MTLSVELSGLQAAQTDLDTIGNNIANVSTTGFKSTRAEFADVYGSSLIGTAGNNAVPGQGVKTSSLAQLFSEGTITTTGNALDIAINGNGFLQVQTPSGIAYTRDGALQINAKGILVNSNGSAVLGYGPPATGTTGSTAAGTVGAIQISQSNISPNATANLTMNVNLPADDPAIDTTTTPFSIANPASYNESSTTTVYDSLGVSRTLTTYYTEVSGSGPPPNWETHYQLSDSTGAMVASGAGATLSFDSSGQLTAGSGTISVATLPDGAAALAINQSFTGSTLSDLPFGINALTNDGTGGGQFAGVIVNSNGDVVAQYTNGATKTMGTIALANFANPQGLIAVSDNNWLASQASGPPLVNAPGTGGLGLLESGALEGSNVDLGAQLVNLISAQQAYQANVQGINVDQQDVQRLLSIQ